MIPRVLIDAANLHTGGGVQVAASFVDELILMTQDDVQLFKHPWLERMTIEISSQVRDSMRVVHSGQDVRVLDSTPRSIHTWRPNRKKYDVSFVIFGPEYGPRRADRRIMGFADVRSVYPSPEGENLSKRQVVHWALRGIVSRRILRGVDCVIVEAPAMRSRIVGLGLAAASQTEVVSNTYNAIFDDPRAWAAPPFRRDDIRCDLLLAYITRPYPHKNVEILEHIHRVAKRDYGMSVKFLVTLRPREWEDRSQQFREACVNVGPVSLPEVPSLYEVSDGAVFPSLLESFSVMPIEAMRMNKIVFASDRDFVRTTCGEGAVYIDPLDPHQSTATIVRVMSDDDVVRQQQELATELVSALPSSKDRARAYLDIIDQQIRLV